DLRRQDERRGKRRSQAPESSLARTRLDALWRPLNRGHGGNPCPRLVLAQARLVSAQLVSVRMRTWRVLKYQRLTPHGSASMGGGQYPFFETKVPSPPW